MVTDVYKLEYAVETLNIILIPFITLEISSDPSRRTGDSQEGNRYVPAYSSFKEDLNFQI